MHNIHVGCGGRTVRCEEMDRRQDMPDRDPHGLPSLNGVCSIPIIVYPNKSYLQRDDGVSVETK